MKWVLPAFLLIFGVLTFACTGSDSNQNSTTGSQTDSGFQDETKGEVGGEKVSPASELECPDTGGLFYGGYESPRLGAMAAACFSADTDGLAIVFTDNQENERSERNAKYTVTGWVEVCDTGCPQEMEATFDLFYSASTKSWKPEASYERFKESQGSVQARLDSKFGEVNQLEAVFDDLTVDLNQSSFSKNVSVIGSIENSTWDDLYLIVKVLSKTGVELTYGARINSDEVERYFQRIEQGYFESEIVEIREYRFLLYARVEGEINGDWKKP